MTGNGKHTTYRNGDDWGMVYYGFTHIIENILIHIYIHTYIYTFIYIYIYLLSSWGIKTNIYNVLEKYHSYWKLPIELVDLTY